MQLGISIHLIYTNKTDSCLVITDINLSPLMSKILFVLFLELEAIYNIEKLPC